MLRLYVVMLAATLAAGAHAEDRIRVLPVELPATGAATLKGRIKGYDIADHVVRLAEGRTLSIALSATHGQAYFNVLPPGSDDAAIFAGSRDGDVFNAEGLAAGDYRIRVYMMRAAARRNEVARYTLNVAIRPEAWRAVAIPGQAFDRTLALQGIRFRVTRGDGKVTVTPDGLSVENRSETVAVRGQIRTAEVADLNSDGSPEIYVLVRGDAFDSPGELIAFSTNNRRSMSRINLPALTAAQRDGWRGGDEMAVVETTLVRRYALWGRDGNPDRPRNRTRQIQYKLKPGEAMWQLVVDRVVEY